MAGNSKNLKGLDFINAVRIFSCAGHNAIGHKRKYSGLPYTVHLQAVADLLAEANQDYMTIAAGWAHDLLEDTSITAEQLAAEFGDEFAALVVELTNIDKPEHGARAARAEINRQHIAAGSDRAKTVKAADIIHNAGTITEGYQAAAGHLSFVKIWLGEKKKVRPSLAPAGSFLCDKLDKALSDLEEFILANDSHDVRVSKIR